MDSVIKRLEYVAVCVLVIVSMFLLPVLAKVAAGQQLASGTVTTSGDLGDSPNIVARGFGSLISGVDGAVDTASSVGNDIANPFTSMTSGIKRAAVSSGVFMAGIGTWGADTIVGGISTVGHSAKVGAATIVTEPIHIVGSVVSLSFADPMIKPSDGEYSPVIEPAAQTLAAMAVAQPTTAAPISYPAVATSTGQTIWPVHGPITTEFGANDSPYQRYHTGIDISNGGRGSGVTPIHPFKPGIVTSVVHSRYGLGNHVIVSHGDGLTSVYGHMSSTRVHKGDSVNQTSVLGLVGSTGASTGPHVHFEIKLNNKYVNPHNYIKGRP